MEILDMAVLGLLIILTIILFILIKKNSELNAKNKKLQEIIRVKDMTIDNYKASRVAVTDVLENISSTDEVMKLINKGESKESISKKLDIPISKIELIIKIDKLKNKS